MSQEAAAVPPQKSTFMGLALRVAIITLIVSLGIVFVVDSIVETLAERVDTDALKSKVRKMLQDEKTRLRLRGLLTNNPAVHYRVSQISEKEGKLATAIEEIELAIGLLELHSSDRAAKERYAARLQELRRQLAAAEAGKAAPSKK